MAAPAPRRAGPGALGFLLLVLGPVAAMEIHTPGVLEVLNGTNVRLKCTFRSSFPVGQKLTVSWYFQTEMKEPLESVLYYNYQAYPSKTGRFLGRLTWDGNIHKNDASVMLHNASPKDNGTFQCHVKNPPDVDGVIGEIQLSVVLKGKRAGWAAGGQGCCTRVPPPHPPLLSLDSGLLRGPHPGPHHRHFLCCDGHRCGGCGVLASLAEDAARQENGGGRVRAIESEGGQGGEGRPSAWTRGRPVLTHRRRHRGRRMAKALVLLALEEEDILHLEGLQEREPQDPKGLTS